MDVFKCRRASFVERMDRGVAVLAISSEKLRNADTPYRFRPDSDFYYLTGFKEPDALLVLAPEHPKHNFVLFVRPQDPAQEAWTGPRVGVAAAVSQYGADAAYPLEEFETRVNELLLGARRLYYRLGCHQDLDRKLISACRTLARSKRRLAPSPTEFIDPAVVFDELRVLKEPDELRTIRQAASISGEAHRLAIAHTRPGRKERELEALLDYTFRARGATGPAYPTIVAGGNNATILHYTENNATLQDGQLVLIDAGCEYDFYSADITRTYPINGRFSSSQRAVYEVVLEAQIAAIEEVASGSSAESIHKITVAKLTEGLRMLGVLTGSLDELIESEAYRPFFMHRTSHYLGMDVHDAGAYVVNGKSRTLETGMILTIEPGLYFNIALDSVPAEFKGIGIRIEDDILITETGREVLTSDTPKTVAELEEKVGSASIELSLA